MLLKPTKGVPHGGGKRLQPDGKDFQVIRQWIAESRAGALSGRN